MKSIDKVTAIFAATVLLLGCSKHEKIYFDTPFVRIEDSNGVASMVVDRKLDNLLTEIRIVLSASSNFFNQPIVVEYEAIVGDGLKEGEDFRIQSSHRSPVTFDPGTYTMPIRVIWYRTDGFDPGKDNTLTLRLTNSSLPEMLLGCPGPDNIKKEFVFTKQ